MVAQVALTMDSIAQSIDTKQERLKDARPHTAPAIGAPDLAKRGASKSEELGMFGHSRSVSPPRGAPQLSPHEWTGTIKEGSKRAKPEAPKFLLLLYEILAVESSRVIRWSEDGLALQILDPLSVADQILPKYFNHTNFHSFQRQLNYFGFRKWTKSKTNICTFSHPYFRENQPDMLQLIKRKKTPRRTSTNAVRHSTATNANSMSKKKSPFAKRKLASIIGSSESFSAQGTKMPIQMNSTAIPIHSAINGIPLSAMTTPHGTSSSGILGFSLDGSSQQYLPELHNVISPVAASECKKKAKILDKKDYLTSATVAVPLPATSEASSSFVHALGVGRLPSSSLSAGQSSLANSNKGFAAAAPPTPIASLPTLNIVRSRLIQRQHENDSEQPPQRFLQHQQYEYNGFSASARRNEPYNVLVPSEHRPDLLTTSLGFTSVTRAGPTSDPTPVFSSPCNDPVNILLRIKKSRTPTEGNGVGTQQEQDVDQNESLASLHNYLLGNSLYTDRLQIQLKYIAEENKCLKQLLDTKQREMDALKGECKALQQENSVLLEEKNKVFNINRDLLSKLFP